MSHSPQSFNDLPKNWRKATLGEIRRHHAVSVDPRRHPRELFELYSVPSCEARRPEITSGHSIGSAKQLLQPDTVLLCKINPRINRVWCVGNHTNHRKIGSSEWICFDPFEGVDPGYLAYFMQQEGFRRFVAANVSGVGGSLMRIAPARIDPYPLFVAPLPEQRRIVAKIDELFSDIDEGERYLARAEALLKQYRQSVLKAAVTGELTRDWRARNAGKRETGAELLQRILKARREAWEAAELAKMRAKGKPPKDDSWKRRYVEPSRPDTSDLRESPEGWAWSSFGELFEIRIGSTPPRNESDFWNGTIPWVSSGEVAFCRIKATRERITAKALDQTSVRLLPRGTVLLAMIGEGKTRVCLCFPT